MPSYNGSIPSIALPYNLKTIGKGTFQGAENLEEIIIPSQIQNIEDGAFENCTSVNKVYFADKPYTSLGALIKDMRSRGDITVGSSLFGNATGTPMHATHDYIITMEKEVNCLEDGIKRFTCAACDNTYTEDVPAVGHQWEESVQLLPTCTEVGKTLHHCTFNCGNDYTTDIPALGHNYPEEWTIEIEPTYNEDGMRSRTCTVCGYKDTEVVNKIVDSIKPQGSINLQFTSNTGSNMSIESTVLKNTSEATYFTNKGSFKYEITATDNESGVKSTEVYVSTSGAVSNIESSSINWTSVNEGTLYSSNVTPTTSPKQVIVYLKVTDNQDNVTYISSEIIEVCSGGQNLSIIGVTNGQVCIAPTTITPIMNNNNVYTVDGVSINTDSYTISGNGNHTISLTNKYGNSYSLTFTIDDMAPGIHMSDGVTYVSWDTLVNVYGMDVEKDYTETTAKTDPSSPYSVITTYNLNGTLIVDSSVTKIGAYAFYGCDTIEEIEYLG